MSRPGRAVAEAGTAVSHTDHRKLWSRSRSCLRRSVASAARGAVRFGTSSATRRAALAAAIRAGFDGSAGRQREGGSGGRAAPHYAKLRGRMQIPSCRSYNVVDLFAGTGGMGLAALSASCLQSSGRIVWTAESNPRYVDTIIRNYRRFATTIGADDQVPSTCTPIDLGSQSAMEAAAAIHRRYGPIDIMVAGPPCQGFSLANRRSRTHTNPLNRLSLLVIRYVGLLQPRLLILENVPGIRTLPSSSATGETTIGILTRKLRRMGYSSTVALLDAANYGVPQFRLRSFLIAAKGIPGGVLPGHFIPPATHGPGCVHPFVTVGDAISDLPQIPNGSCTRSLTYASAPRSDFQQRMREHGGEYVTDHLTSRHSPYVLERYEKVPQGGNWMSIPTMMSNYTDVSRTHLNIYHRLRSDEPARTIGNFRKAMTIHPFETRGLSLREAARLQSIPDWFAFTDPSEPLVRAVVPGLNAYQQQIGNAVSFLLTERLVSHVVQSLD